MSVLSITEEPKVPTNQIRYDYIEPVLIFVGPEKTEFVVKEEHLCRSVFFRNLCKKERGDVVERVINLPDLDPNVFKIYFEWLMREYIYVRPLVKPKEDLTPWNTYDKNTSTEESEAHLTLLAAAYAYGQKIADGNFCNDVVDFVMRVVDSTARLPSLPVAEEMWKKVSSNSKMAILIVDYMATDSKAGIQTDGSTAHSPAFLLEVAKAVMRNKDSGMWQRGPRYKPKGFYHVPADSR